jgi:hypothetical protein
MARTKKRAMSDSHKAALAEGRAEGRVVKSYLEAVEQNRPRRGRKRTTESIKKRLAAIDNQVGNASPLQRLQLIQERMDLQGELEHANTRSDLSGLETAFVKTAKQYSARKGISYAAWREMGVAPEVLKRAGITRGGS